MIRKHLAAVIVALSIALASVAPAAAQSLCSAPPQSPLYFWGSPNIQINDGADQVGKLTIEGFAFWGWGPLPQRGWCGQIINSLSQITIDIKHIGMNGIDVNSNGEGNMPPPGAYDVHLWAIPGDPTATPPVPDTVAAVVSLQGSSVLVPHDPAYNIYRKMPYNVIVREGPNGRFIVPSTVTGWPTPCVSFTTADVDAASNMTIQTYSAPTNGWSALNVTAVIGENSNFAYWRAIVSGGTASVWLSPSNTTPGNPYYKTLALNQTGSGPSLPVRTTSQGTGQPAMLYVWTGNYTPSVPGGGQPTVKLVIDKECVSEQTD